MSVELVPVPAPGESPIVFERNVHLMPWVSMITIAALIDAPLLTIRFELESYVGWKLFKYDGGEAARDFNRALISVIKNEIGADELHRMTVSGSTITFDMELSNRTEGVIALAVLQEQGARYERLTEPVLRNELHEKAQAIVTDNSARELAAAARFNVNEYRGHPGIGMGWVELKTVEAVNLFISRGNPVETRPRLGWKPVIEKLPANEGEK